MHLSLIGKRVQQACLASTALIIFGAGFALGSLNTTRAAQQQDSPQEAQDEAFAYFWQAFHLIQEQYIEDVPLERLVEGATNGMLEALDDPFSGYMNPELYSMLNDELEGEIQGIGVAIRTDAETGEIVVISVMNGTPAAAAGIMPGDVFLEVDGEDALAMTQLELAARVRGAEGTPVDIVMRRGEERIAFTIVRARITIPNVEYEVLEGDIAYLRLNQFTFEARREMDEALREMRIQDRAGLIIDFRDNPGGLLTSAVDVASLLIDGGPVVIEEFGTGSEQVFNANGTALDIDIPIVLLVNEGSASGSELVAGAWQDRELVTIIGTPTFGKGTVQTWHALSNGGGLRLTIARWLTPERRWIHETGIAPDIEVEWVRTSPDDTDDPQLAAALAHIAERTTVDERAAG